MKKILTSGLIIGLATGAANALLAYLLGNSVFETPFVRGTETHEPLQNFAMASGIATLVLTLIGALLLGLLYGRLKERGIRIWTIVGIVFLVLYGLMPFMAPGVATTKAAILANILHLVAGIPALILLPRRATS